MSKLVVTCPSCQGALAATRLHCEHCDLELQGSFEFPALLRLSSEDLAFVTTFVRESGSLKAMAEHTGTSYPTVRNRLNEIIERLDTIVRTSAARANRSERDLEKERHAILDALEKGELTAEAAAKKLRKVGP